LKLDPIGERTEIMAQVKAAGGAHTAQNAFLFAHAEVALPCGETLGPQQIAGDDRALNFAGTLVNG